VVRTHVLILGTDGVAEQVRLTKTESTKR